MIVIKVILLRHQFPEGSHEIASICAYQYFCMRYQNTYWDIILFTLRANSRKMDENMEIRSQLIADSEIQRIGEAGIAAIIQRLQNSLERFSGNSETQSSILQNIQDDLLLHFDDNSSHDNAGIAGSSDENGLNVEATLDCALAQGAHSGDE